ncbi:MAG: dicarboxylate/amino acid:cation symporter [bacterium]|nr:dicarboxylate/amino acid:cation symporter [bacterium]
MSGSRKILIGIIVAIFLGVAVGGLLPGIAVNFSILGKIFLSLLMMIVVPLVMFSIIVGITNLGDVRKIGSIGKRTILYYFATTGISVLIGIILVNIIQPGAGITPGEKHPGFSYQLDTTNNRVVTLVDQQFDRYAYDDKYVLILADQGVKGNIQTITPTAVTVAMWEGLSEDETVYLKKKDGSAFPVRKENGQLMVSEKELQSSGRGVEITLTVADRIRAKEDKGILSTIEEVVVGNKAEGREGMIPRNVFNAMQRMEILPLIFFSLLFGAALSVLGERAQKGIEFISILNDTILKIVDWIMYVAPFGIFGIIAARIGQAGGFQGFLPELAAVGKYSFTVILGLGVHGLVILPLILYFIGRRTPVKFLIGVGSALLNAFSTASSSATLPLTMEAVEKQNGISKRTANFVLPIGATINMDGTALYEAVAAMFIAQVYGIELGAMQQLIIFLTATLAAIGAAGIPEAGLVTMVIVLKAVGLPIEGIGLILTIDWLLDRFRTTVNVWGDSVGAGVIETLEQKTQPENTTKP